MRFAGAAKIRLIKSGKRFRFNLGRDGGILASVPLSAL